MERWTIREVLVGQYHTHINSGGPFPSGWGKFDYAATLDLGVETVEIVHPNAVDGMTREHFPSLKKGIERGWAFLQERGLFVTSLLIEVIQIERHPPDYELRGSPHGSGFFFDLIRQHGVRGQPVDPRWRAWNGGAVLKLARVIQAEQTFEHLPILADALEDAGCDDLDILGHLRGPGQHAHGCWVIDALLGKE